MTDRRLVFRPAARRELLDARDWYDQQQLGLGQEFAEAIDLALSKIVGLPESFPRIHGDIRRAVLRRFPYAVYFGVQNDEIVILGVVHGRRDPAIWKSRS